MVDNMKKYVLLIYILVLVTFVSYATYSPTAAMMVESERAIAEDEIWTSLSYGGDFSPLGWRWGDLEMSMPIRISYVTSSLPSHGSAVPRKYKAMAGISARYYFTLVNLFLSYYSGVVDYPEIKAVTAERRIEGGVGFSLGEHLSLSIPLHYSFSPVYPSFGGGIMMRVGGEV